MPIRVPSFARAHGVQRRIYRIDGWIIPLPGGVPLTGLAWFGGLVAVAALASRLPGATQLAHVVGWPAWLLAGPGVGAAVCSRPTTDGRGQPERLIDAAAWRWNARGSSRSDNPARLHVRAWVARDVHGGLHRGRCTGPAVVQFTTPVEITPRRRGRLDARPAQRGQAWRVELEAAQRLEVHGR